MNPKLNYDYILEQINERGFALLSPKYENAYAPIIIECNKGHIYETTWKKFKSSKHCPICYGRQKKTLTEVKNIAKQYGYEYLSDSYNNYVTKVKLRCPQGHIYESRWGSFAKGARCPICWNNKNKGYTHWNWKGEMSSEPYCHIWSEIRDIIKERDNNKCLNPECTSGKNLCVHHVDYNKKNCGITNLITVCKSCNAKANFDREWHTSWYQAILTNRYKYQY